MKEYSDARQDKASLLLQLQGERQILDSLTCVGDRDTEPGIKVCNETNTSL